MTERERLIKLLEQCSCHYSPPCTGECGDCYNVEMYDRNIEHIADHLIANGVIVPPCKVGDTVYLPWEYDGIKSIAGLKVTSMINIIGFGWSFGTDFDTDDEGYAEKYKYGRFKFEDIGKTVFLTREDAEKALAERGDKT